MQHPRLLVTAALLAAMITACGGSDSAYSNTPTTPTTPPTSPGGTTGTTANSVVIANEAFSPGTVEVPAGTTVTWQWKSCDDTGGYGGYGTCVSHNVTFDDGSGVASSTQSTGTFSRAFSTAGTYKYHCTIHGASMSGVVTVK